MLYQKTDVNSKAVVPEAPLIVTQPSETIAVNPTQSNFLKVALSQK